MYFRLLTEADVASLLSIDELIDAMKSALVQFSTGTVVQPVRSVLPIGAGRSFFGVMPASLGEPATVGAKLVTVFPGNADRALPTHLATILLFSAETGALVAMMDGRYVTEARTAAVSAVSAVALARDETETMAIIGSGVQARSHLTTLETVFELSEVRVWSPDPIHLGDFIDEMTPITKAPLTGTAAAAHAVRDADLIVLATSSPEPVIRNEWVKDGAHVISVGACRPNEREMDPALVQRGVLYVDSREAALVESGDLVLGIQEGRFTASHIAGELGAVLAGTAAGRRWPNDVTIFKSLGLAVEDVVAAELIYRRAVSMDVGQELEL
jgi:alanine dehydrogenase